MERQRFLRAALMAAATVVVFWGCQEVPTPAGETHAGTSMMLRTVEAAYTPIQQTRKGSEIIAAADTTSSWAKWLADFAIVGLADLGGAAVGAEIGSRAGATIENEHPERARGVGATSSFVGAALGAIWASAVAYDGLGNGDARGSGGDGTGGGTPGGGSKGNGSESGGSSEGSDDAGSGIVIRRPSIHPYSSTTKPTGIDSLGWLHNEGVIYLCRNLRTRTVSDYRHTLLSWTKEVMTIDAWLIENVAAALFTDDWPNSVSLSTTMANAGSHLRQGGRITEGNYVDSLHAEMQYLARNGYGMDAILALVRAYRDTVVELDLTAERRSMLEQELTVYVYSLALWSANL